MKYLSFRYRMFFSYAVIALLFSMLAACSPTVQHVAKKEINYLRLDESFALTDEQAEKMILPYREALMEKMNEVIAFSDTELIKGRPGSTMGNWFADALLDAARRIHSGRVDFAIQNYGGLVILQLDGAQTLGLMNRIAEIGGWPISRGTGFTMLDGKAVNIHINGTAFDPEKNYYVALSDYVADGGDNTENLAGVPRIETGVPIRDLIISECKNQGNLIIDPYTRIK
jgi:2',3'-cyclic-nucleotide 2'-phosphodiesterase (5'-nucleotidase family)